MPSPFYDPFQQYSGGLQGAQQWSQQQQVPEQFNQPLQMSGGGLLGSLGNMFRQGRANRQNRRQMRQSARQGINPFTETGASTLQAQPEQQAYDQQGLAPLPGAPGRQMNPQMQAQMEMARRQAQLQQMQGMMGQQRGQMGYGGYSQPMMGQMGQMGGMMNPQMLQQLMMSNQLYGQRGLKPQGRSPRGY
ncbi:MAG: hypothetical protein ACYSUQ_08210 [Planctomycetota bacterium]|jgi:hypothetical protein